MDIEQFGDEITFSMISAEIPPNDVFKIKRLMALSFDNRIKGKLRLKDIKTVKIDNKIFQKKLKMFFECADIFKLKIKESITLQVIWENFRVDKGEKGFSTIEIDAGSIYWENIPDLLDPFWRTEPFLPEYENRAHYHRLNPKATGNRNKYLDKNGNGVSQGSNASCLLPNNFIEKNFSWNKVISPNIGALKILKKYEMEFHDGILVDIKEKDKDLSLVIISAEINTNVRINDIPLSQDRRIKGVLHFKKIKNIIYNYKFFEGVLKKYSDCGDITYFKIEDNKVFLDVIWGTFKPHFKEIANSSYEIEAEEIYWEPVPDLNDPNW
ncbi:hypothetical protein CSEC_0356 [Criblamydia sequanensis CRIB-18]|uniref:Uncharacterized protein n=2 Tax=Candidatus Criblamydia sequanensis TaxID=340071 RepID=A0A090D071_9BACT|nr:hypothetical protein CSEC_0356 [Criblamydia sequanensis CRIB-18]